MTKGARGQRQGRLVRQARNLVGELSKFGVVGIINLSLDVALFNLLLHFVIPDKPLTSKGISTVVAATSSYFMNRHWTWRDRARTGIHRKYLLFVLLSGIGLGIAETCLLITHYGLGLTSQLADNLSANGAGLVLGTAWRFWSFKKWVFLPTGPEPAADSEAGRAAAV